MARRIGDPELLGRTLNNFCLAVWGRPGAAELRLAAADEALALAGKGLPRRTEFVAHLHRAPIRLHLTDLAGFEEDHAEARRLAVSLSGPEVRPHVLWQAGGLAWLRGNAARAEELTTEAYELYRRVTPHARHAYAAHQFTLRRADARQADAIPLLVETGDEGSPLLQEMAVLAAAESGDLAEARRLRARWGRTLMRDWASDVAVLPAGGVGAVAGRRAGLGGGGRVAAALPRAAGGARDAVAHAGRLRRAARPDRRAPRRPRRPPATWWQAAREQGVLVGSPHQVALAASHLARVGLPRRGRESARRRPGSLRGPGSAST